MSGGSLTVRCYAEVSARIETGRILEVAAKTPTGCHPEEPQATKDLCKFVETANYRDSSLALRMTVLKRFSTASKTPPSESSDTVRVFIRA